VLISGCSDCTIVVCAVSTLLRLDACERLTLTAAAGQVTAVSCHSCTLNLGTPRPPALLGDCRFITLGPFNTRYEGLADHMRAVGMPFGGPSQWDQPLLCCGREGGPRRPAGSGGVTPGSPLTAHHTPSVGGVAGASAAALGRDAREGPGQLRPVLLMQPEEFLPFVVPFKGGPGPLAGGAAAAGSGGHWAMGLFAGGGAGGSGNSGGSGAAEQQQQQQQRAAPPADAAAPPPPSGGWAFALPAAFENAFASKYEIVTALRGRIKGAVLDDARRHQLQGVIQSYFREWLHSSGAIRQVFDLSKLEADEQSIGAGPLGSSPPPGGRAGGVGAGAFADLAAAPGSDAGGSGGAA
jgi:hypothetical protein